MDILCVGQMVADILIQGVDEVDFSVDTKRVKKIAIQNGGDCLNTAIDLRKLGHEVGITGVLGKDAMGQFLTGVLKEHGIDNRGIRYVEHCDTSTVAAVINSRGDRVFLYYGGTNDIFSLEHVDQQMVKQARFIHVGGTFMLPGFDGAGAAGLFQEAHKNGGFTTMDVTYDTSGRWMDIIEPCLPHLDLFMPSINEAEKLTGTQSPEEIARVLKEKGVKHVMVKLGEKGCYVNAFGEEFYQPAYPVEVVDTTGAGDSFVAGVLSGLSRNWDIRRTTAFASAVSAHCIQKLGATAGIPPYEIVKEFMHRNHKQYA